MKKIKSGKRCGLSEVLLLFVFILTMALVCASVVVVNISIVNMYNSLYDSAYESMKRAAVDSAGHIDVDISGTSHVGTMLSDNAMKAFDTPRIPSLEEKNAYEIISNSSLDGGMKLLVASNDHGGGPAAVMYHIEGYNDTHIDYVVEY